MKSNWSVLHTIGKIFSRAMRYSLTIPKKTWFEIDIII
jgi:hypothetical protein